jgi:hypothetical protein
MDAGGRTNQETESRSPYARAERNKRIPRVPVGQDIGVAFFLVTSFLATQKEVTRHQAKYTVNKK